MIDGRYYYSNIGLGVNQLKGYKGDYLFIYFFSEI